VSEAIEARERVPRSISGGEGAPWAGWRWSGPHAGSHRDRSAELGAHDGSAW